MPAGRFFFKAAAYVKSRSEYSRDSPSAYFNRFNPQREDFFAQAIHRTAFRVGFGCWLPLLNHPSSSAYQLHFPHSRQFLMIGCWKHMVSLAPYTDRELPDLQNVFLPEQSSNIFSWKHNHERRSWSRTKIFLGKKQLKLSEKQWVLKQVTTHWFAVGFCCRSS